MMYREIIAVCSQIHTKHINTQCGQNVELYIKIQSIPRSKHTVSVIKTSQLMLYKEIIAVCSQIHTKHINTMCGQNVAFVNVQPGGIYSDQWALCWNVTRFVAQPQFLCVLFIPFSTFWMCAAIFWKTDFTTRRVTYIYACQTRQATDSALQ